MNKTKVIYLMGAGRSGTTVLATLLGASDDIRMLGELHQLPVHVTGSKDCSCGKAVGECGFWQEYAEPLAVFGSSEYQDQAKYIESHSQIWRHLINPEFTRKALVYREANQKLFDQCSDQGRLALLDSAKFIGRALALWRLERTELKVIYLVRDPRGVVESFSKNVQTSRSTLSACIYYLMTNIVAEVVKITLLRGKVLKLRYEDLLESPQVTLERISDFAEVECHSIVRNLETVNQFDVGHIVGGNRLRENKTISLSNSVSWIKKMSRRRQLLVYLLTFPLNILNRYRP